MHQQRLMVLHPTVKKKMHLQENTLFGLDTTVNIVQCLLHHVTYAPTKFEVAKSKYLGGDVFQENRFYLLSDLHML